MNLLLEPHVLLQVLESSIVEGNGFEAPDRE